MNTLKQLLNEETHSIPYYKNEIILTEEEQKVFNTILTKSNYKDFQHFLNNLQNLDISLLNCVG